MKARTLVGANFRNLAVMVAGGATFAVMLAAGVVAKFGDAVSAEASGVAATADDAMPSTVEDYSYPGAAQVLAERGIKLHRGDGHIMLADCGADPNNPPPDLILVQSYNLNVPGNPNYCFKATGSSGYLELEIAQAYFVRGENGRTISAKVETKDEPTVIDVERVDPGEWQPVGESQSRGEATILELRFPYQS
ncbi:hypothetical protein ACI2K4_03640 [Micromonospora sp. NPDC050397]|uniref:hypothetical protein n=1 Tax=Micromonospora sp. NPDC050397 TaxID=3364279 RepID=UPI003851403A